MAVRFGHVLIGFLASGSVVLATFVAPGVAAAATLPAVSAVSPASGKTLAGTRITVTGSGFSKVSAVLFGSTAGKSISVRSTTKLQVTAPAHAAGVVDVRVKTTAGTSAIRVADHYTFVAPPTITAEKANSGPAAGSTRVSVTGSNFLHVTAVTFGGVAGTGLTVASSKSLSVTAPPHAAGQVDVKVTTSYGSSAAVSADKFTFVAGQYTIQVGISQVTVTNAGGWANALAGAQTMIVAINNTYNDPANHLAMHYNFIASSITEYTDATSTEFAAAHPNGNFRLLIADDSDMGGGWIGDRETVVDYWHYMSEHAFSQNSIDGTVHEFGHARGGIDEYQLDVASTGNSIDSTSFMAPRPSIMSYPYDVHTFDTYTQGLINREGDTLEHSRPETVAAQSIPATINVNVLRGGVALSGATVTLYPVAWASGKVTTTPSFTASTGPSGSVALPADVFGQSPNVQAHWNIPTPMFLVTVDYLGSHASTWLDIIDAGLFSFSHPGSPYALTVLTKRSRDKVAGFGSKLASSSPPA